MHAFLLYYWEASIGCIIFDVVFYKVKLLAGIPTNSKYCSCMYRLNSWVVISLYPIKNTAGWLLRSYYLSRFCQCMIVPMILMKCPIWQSWCPGRCKWRWFTSQYFPVPTAIFPKKFWLIKKMNMFQPIRKNIHMYRYHHLSLQRRIFWKKFVLFEKKFWLIKKMNLF